jgi:hypothetical protein
MLLFGHNYVKPKLRIRNLLRKNTALNLEMYSNLRPQDRITISAE